MALSPATQSYLGRTVPAPEQNQTETATGPYFGDAAIYISSGRPDKIGAAFQAISTRFMELYGERINFAVRGIKVSSDIAVQPIGDAGRTGAENRLANLKKAVEPQLKDPINRQIFLVSLEYAMVRETIESHNPDVFQNEDGTTWVDRCFVVIENANTGRLFFSTSVGVTTPKDCMEEAGKSTPEDYEHKDTGYAVKASTLIAKKHDVPREKWHEKLSGVSRIDIIRDAIMATQFV